MGHPPFPGASCRAKHQPRLNRELVSSQSPTGVADPRGHETGLFLIRKPHTLPWLGLRSRKSGVLRVVCEGWDTTNLDTDALLSIAEKSVLNLVS